MGLSLGIGLYLGSASLGQGVGPMGRVTNPSGMDRYRLVARPNIPTVTPYINAGLDSISKGVGWDGTNNDLTNDNARIYSWPDILSGKLATRYGGVASGFLQPFSDVSDSLVTQSGTATTTSIGLTGVARTLTAGATNTYVTLPCTAVDVAYWESNGTNSNPTTGSFSFTIDGGAPVSVNYAGTVAAYKKVSVTGLAPGVHTVVVTGVSGTTYYCGTGYRSANSVVVGRFARSGRTMLDHLGEGSNNNVSAAGRIRLALAFGMCSPAVFIIMTGINECMNQFVAGQLSTVALTATKIQAAADAVIATGGCVLLVGEPEPPYAPPLGGEPFSAYRAAMMEIARNTAHCSYVDSNAILGGPAAAVAAGYQNSGSAHLTTAGEDFFATRMDLFLAA